MKRNYIDDIFDNLASKTVLTLLSLIAAGITIYLFVNENKVELRYEIVANTNVLDFNADIGKLEVIYDSSNLKLTKENLRIYTVKVTNAGSQHLLKEYYDINDPVGLKLTTGQIIEKPEVIQASNAYLTRHVQVQNYSYQQISFSQVIIEKGEYFIIKLLVLHPTDHIPSILSSGKIAGQQQIPVVDAIDVKEELSFWEQVFYGHTAVQVVKLVIYFIIGVLILFAVIAISTEYDSWKDKRKKRKLVQEFKNLETYSYSRMDDAIFDRYYENHPRTLVEMLELTKDEEILNQLYEKLRSKRKPKPQEAPNKFFRFFRKSHPWLIISDMKQDGLVFQTDQTLQVNHAMKETLNQFVAFLEEKDVLNYKTIADQFEQENEADLESDSTPEIDQPEK